MKQRLFRFSVAFGLMFAVFVSLTLTSCGGSGGGGVLSVEEQYSRASTLYEKNKFLESSEEFQKVIYNYPGETIVDTAQYYLALSYMYDEQFQLAAVEFDRLVRSYPRSPFVTESHYRIGYCYFHSAPKHYGLDQTELVRSIKLIESFILDFPESEWVAEARQTLVGANTRLSAKDYKAAVQYTRIRAWESALIYFQRVIDLHPTSEHAGPSLLGKGEALYKSHKWDDAALALNSFVALYPGSDQMKHARKLLAKVEHDRPAQPIESADSSESSDSTDSTDSTKTESIQSNQ